MEIPKDYWETRGMNNFNRFSDIPEEYQPQVVKTLRFLCEGGLLMSNYELYLARQNSQTMLIENTFGDAADSFAKAIDPQYKGFRNGGPISSRQNVLPARSTFYQMIRHYSREQLQTGIKMLEEITS